MTEDNTLSRSEVYEAFLTSGDLSNMSTEQREAYIVKVCQSLGLNPMTRPFRWIKTKDGKLIPYCTRDGADQLRRINGVSLRITERTLLENGCYVVTAQAVDKYGRTDESTGVVFVGSMVGDDLANKLMVGETKAKRRVTLSICGLGFMDELEARTIGVEVEEDSNEEGPKRLTPAYPPQLPQASTSNAFNGNGASKHAPAPPPVDLPKKAHTVSKAAPVQRPVDVPKAT